MEFGVEPICRVLTEHGVKIAPSTYYDARSRRPSKRTLRDGQIVALIQAERSRQKLFARLGARKMWLHLRGQGHEVARCTVERLYRQQGWVGALRQRRLKALPSDGTQRPGDLVDRQFWASRPNQLWVADFQCRRRHCRSATHSRSGASGEKLRSTRSAGLAARGSLIVVRLTLPRTAPRSSSSPISRSTVHRAIGGASAGRSRFSVSQTFLAP